MYKRVFVTLLQTNLRSMRHPLLKREEMDRSVRQFPLLGSPRTKQKGLRYTPDSLAAKENIHEWLVGKLVNRILERELVIVYITRY